MLWLQLIWPHLAWYDRWQNLGYLHFYLDQKKGTEITLTSSTSSHSLHIRITGLCVALTEMFTDLQVKLGLCWGLWGNFPLYPSTGSVLLTLMIRGISMPIIYSLLPHHITSVCHHKNPRNLPKKGSPEGTQSTTKHRGGLNIGATHISSLPEHFFTISHEGDNTVLLSNLFQYFIFKAIRKLFLAHGVLVTAWVLAGERFGWQRSMCMGVAFNSRKY